MSLSGSLTHWYLSRHEGRAGPNAVRVILHVGRLLLAEYIQ